MKQNTIYRWSAILLMVILLFTMTACHDEGKETTSQTQGSEQSTVYGGDETDKSTQEIEEWIPVEQVEPVLTLLTMEEAKKSEDELISELWTQLLGKVYRDYNWENEYQINTYAERFPLYSDSFVAVELFGDEEIHLTGGGIDRSTELNAWTTESMVNAEYHSDSEQIAGENSVFSMKGSIRKSWTEAFEPYVKNEYKQNTVVQVYEMLIGTAGQLYRETKGGIAGEFEATIYLTEHSIDKSALKCTYWICIDEGEPVCVTGTYRKGAAAGEEAYRYEVDAAAVKSVDALKSEAVLTIEVAMNTVVHGNGKLLEYSLNTVNAEREGRYLLECLWRPMVECGLVDVGGFVSKGEAVLYEYDRSISAPWIRPDELEDCVLSGVHLDKKQADTLYLEGKYVQEDMRLEFVEGSEDRSSGDDVCVRVHIVCSLERIGDVPLGIDTEGDMDRQRVAEILLGTALRYAVEQVEWESAYHIGCYPSIYLTNCTYDIDAPEGIVLIQMRKDEQPVRLKIVYDGSCRESVTGYTIWKSADEQPFYEVKNALLLKVNGCTVGLHNTWCYDTMQAFMQYDESAPYSGKYGVFEGEAADCDGDGRPDRIFRKFSEDQSTDDVYLFASDGSYYLLDSFRELDGSIKDACLSVVDLTGDGVPEVVYQEYPQDAKVLVLERTANGLKQMQHRYETNAYVNQNSSGDLNGFLVIEREEGTSRFYYKTADGSTMLEFELAEEEVQSVSSGRVTDPSRPNQSIVFYIINASNAVLIENTETGQYGFQMVGYLIPRIQVEWDLMYEDGIWVVKNLVQTDKLWKPEGQMKTEVENAWLEQEIYPVGQDDPYKLVWVDVTDADSLRYRPRYYGTYGDAVVIFQTRVGSGMSLDITVAGEKFYSLNWFGIYVYHEGKFCYIDEAYEQGILTAENIKTIADYHEWFEHTYFQY